MNTDLGSASSCEEVQCGIENDKELTLASAPVLQWNFTSKSITKEQIAKLQALRRQRLQSKHTNVFTKKKVTQNKKTVNDRWSCSLNHANTSMPVMRDGGNKVLGLKHQEFDTISSGQLPGASESDHQDGMRQDTGNRDKESSEDEAQSSTRAEAQRDKPHLPRKRSQKLCWGLDVKERWERKGNM